MAATKKSKASTPAAPAATKTKAGAGSGATKNTKVTTNGSNPGAAPKKPVAAKKAAAIKLTDKQRELLKAIQSKGVTGHLPANKNEEKSLESLATKKLLKKGKKDKEKGFYAYMLTKAGEKELSAPAAQ